MTSEQLAHVYAAMGGMKTPEPYRALPDGTALWVYAMTYGKGRLCIGHVDNRIGYDRGYCYESLAIAFVAAELWDGTGEPQGWFKNLQTGEYSAEWQQRNGTSLLEVLFAVAIISIALLGIVSVFIYAGSQARRGQINDASVVVARRGTSRFDTMAMRRPDHWVIWNPAGRFEGVPFDDQGLPQILPGTAICIDPRFVAKNGGQQFPLSANAVCKMHRVSLVSGLRTTDGKLIYSEPMAKAQADFIFQLNDDLVANRPDDHSRPAVLTRESEGRYSWLATLTPQLNLIAERASDQYTLSIVVFHDRPSDLLQERVVNVAFVGDGSAGGEVILYAPHSGSIDEKTQSTANELLKLTAGNWVMISGVAVSEDERIQRSMNCYSWYRVTECEGEAGREAATATLPERYAIYASLSGQDWSTNRKSPQATILDGVVMVAERTIRLELAPE